MSRRFRDDAVRAFARRVKLTNRSLRRAAVVTAAALSTMVLPATALGAAKGIETDITWNASTATQVQDAVAMKDLGVGWTRMALSWHDAEPSRGRYSSKYLGSIDNAVKLARATGAAIDMVVSQSPQWASGSSDKNAPPQNPQDYATFVHAMAKRYAGQVSAWEIWNEENYGRFWGGSPNAGAYDQLLKLAYPAVKSADGSAQVLFGGLSTNDYNYLQAAYDSAPDLGSYYDVMATHPYSPPSSPSLVFYDGNRISKNAFAGYREVHQTMLSHGDDKPIWLTEFGWATTSQPGWGVSAQEQADYTKLAYQCLQQDPYVQVAVLYELRNNSWANDADDWEDQLGLLNTDWSQKPAYAAFRSVDPNQGGCSYATASDQPAGTPSSGAASSGTPSSGPASSGSSLSSATSAPNLVLRVKAARQGPAALQRVHSSRSATGVKTAVPVKVFGRVIGAEGGRVFLTLQHRVHGMWRRGFRKTVAVKRDGSFTTRQLKGLQRGGWRVRGAYVAAAKPAKASVYFQI